MRLILSLLILMIFPILGNCQKEKKIEKGDVLIKVSPLSMFPTNLPYIEIGASYHFNEKSGLQVKYGKKMDIYNPDDIHKNDGYKMTLEFMFFINKLLYVSIEGGYLNGKYTDNIDYYESDWGEDEIRDYFTAFDEKVFLTPKVGVMLFATKRICIDFFGGLGGQYHYRAISDLEFDPTNGNIWTDYTEWGFAAPYEEIDKVQFRLSLGFNLNYRF